MKTYCFDFDGTIADTIPLIINKTDYFLKKSGEREITEDLLRKIREEGIEGVFRQIDIPKYKLFFLYLKLKKEMRRDVEKMKVNDEVKMTLIRLKNEGNRLGILTSNSKENARSFLEKNNLNFFDFINSSGILGKERELKKLKRKGGIFVYIGDEDRDIKAGRRAGVKTVAVAWGLSSRKALLREKPDILIEQPSDLLNLSF
jgi:phosphoglycolate phosphatase